MAPKEPIRLNLRWEFRPAQHRNTGFVSWTWHAYTQAGRVAMQSERSFDTFTDCIEDAKLHGYQLPA